MSILEYNEVFNEQCNLKKLLDKIKPENQKEAEQIELIRINNEHNIFLIKNTIKKGYNIEQQEELEIQPGPEIHPVDYLDNYKWLDELLNKKVAEINELRQKTFEDDKLAEFYNNLSNETKKYFYNEYQIKKLLQFIAIIEAYLINTAQNAKRYKSNNGTWFIGAGIDVFHRDKPQRKKKPVLKRVFDLGYGNGEGAERRLRDVSDILYHFKIEVITNYGSMD